MLKQLETQIRYYPAVHIDVHRTHDNHLVETATYGGVEYHKTIIAITTQIGCPSVCDFCLVGDRRFIRNIDGEEHLDQVRATLENESNVPWLDRSKEVKVSLCRSGESLLNSQTLEGVTKIAERYAPNFQVASIMPAREVSYKILDELAYFARDYAKPFQLIVSMHTTDEEKRKKMISYSSLMKFSDIAKAGEQWFEKTSGKRKINLSFALMDDNEVNLQSLSSKFDPAVFAVRLGFYLPTTQEKAIMHPPSSIEKVNKLEEEARDLGYLCIKSIAKDVEFAWDCRSDSTFKLLRKNTKLGKENKAEE